MAKRKRLRVRISRQTFGRLNNESDQLNLIGRKGAAKPHRVALRKIALPLLALLPMQITQTLQVTTLSVS